MSRNCTHERYKSVTAGINSMDVRRGINLAVEAVVAHLKTRAKLSSTTEGIAQRKSRAPELNYKMIRKAHWVDWWSTPAWMKIRLKLIPHGRFQSRASYSSRDWSQDTAQGSGSGHIHTAGSTSEAIAVLKKNSTAMHCEAYVKVLQMCLKQKDLLAAKQVHDCIIESGMDKNPYVANTLLNVYIRCGELSDARRIFNHLQKKSIITWNVMIAGYARTDHVESALELFNQMRRQGAQPNEVTYLSVLKAFSSPLSLKRGREVHVCIAHSGFESDVRVGTALLQMYAKCGSIKEARRIFENLTNRNIITWNTMIGAYTEGGQGVEAYRLFLQMRREGFKPDAITYMSILKSCASMGALELVREVHADVTQAGLELDLRLGNALVHSYAKRGALPDARMVFYRMEKRDVVTWNTIIGGLAQHGCWHEAYRLFLQMRRTGFEPDAFSYVSILNGSASEMPLERVKEVHGHARKAGLESDMRVGNALVHMYAKSGSIDDARLVFDKMERRDVVTWNTMIGGLTQHGCAQEAYRLFLQMRRDGFEPDALTFAILLNASASCMPLEWVKEVHGQAGKAGLETDLRVGTALVHMYAKSGSIDDARLVFERIGKRDVVTWNTMIGGLAQHGCAHEAYRLFLQMRREGFEPDSLTYASILNASGSEMSLEWVREIHAHAQQAGLESNLRVGSALVHMYAKSGSIDDARLVFDRVEKRDVVTWNTMIGGLAQHGCGHEAYAMFLQMRQEGFEPDAFTYASILSGSASETSSEWLQEVHGHARKSGLESDLRVGTALVHRYAKTGAVDDARLIFERMEKRDVVTWTVMISGLAQHGCAHEAYRLFLQMRREGFEPDAFTYASILNSPSSEMPLEWVREIHGCARKAGLESDLRIGNALVHRYAKSGFIDDAGLVFERMEKRDVVTWNTIIGGLAHHGFGHEAYRLFLQMRREGFEPDALTYAGILNAPASEMPLEWVKEVHGHARQAGLESDLRVGNALIHMYAKSGGIDDSRLVFESMEKRDVVTWNTMIGGLALHGCGHEAVELFRKMNVDRMKPDGTSLCAVLSACSHAGLLDDGRRLFVAMKQDYGIEPDIVHYNCRVDLLGRAGLFEEAKHFISDMPVEPNAVTWRALLGACRTHGNVELGELAAKQLFKLEPNDASAYVLLSNIFSAAGKWEKASLVRSMMQKRGVRKDPGRSWIEVDNKIHEFVVRDTAHPEAKAIYSYMNKLTSKLKAEGYVPDTQLVLLNMDEEEKELALCSHSEKLAIAYGLMRIPREKPIRVYKNLRVCSDCHTATKFISKVTGREIIARDANRFHRFQDGTCSCGDYW